MRNSSRPNIQVSRKLTAERGQGEAEKRSRSTTGRHPVPSVIRNCGDTEGHPQARNEKTGASRRSSRVRKPALQNRDAERTKEAKCRIPAVETIVYSTARTCKPTGESRPAGEALSRNSAKLPCNFREQKGA